MSNKEVLILFGTETGNAEDLADQAGNEANKYDLVADIRGMDEVTIDELVTSKRVIIFCSTWGDGEQPYNCLLYTSPSPRDLSTSRMPSSA